MTRLWSQWGFIAALVFATACWGVGAVMSKYALSAIPPVTLLIVQLSVVLLWVGVLAQDVRVPLDRNTVQLGLCGGCHTDCALPAPCC